MASLPKQFVGNSKARQQLQNYFRGDHFPTALMLVGPDGVGKKTLALMEIQNLFCTQKVDGLACGKCRYCHSVLELQSDFMLVLGEDASSLKVDAVRAAKEFLSLQILGKKRFVIIDNAERLTMAAANALLKNIEEPPKDSHFILISSKPYQLLPTIRSRCQVLKFQALKSAEMESVGISEAWVRDMCRGQVELGRLLESEEVKSLRQLSIEFCKEVLAGCSVKQRPNLKLDKSNTALVFLFFQSFIRDSFLLKRGLRDQIVNPDCVDLLEDLGTREDSALMSLYDQFQDLLRATERNADKSLVLDAVASRWRDF